MRRDPDNLTTKDCRRSVFSPKSHGEAQNLGDIDGFDVSTTAALLWNPNIPSPFLIFTQLTRPELSEIEVLWISLEVAVRANI